MKQLLITSPHYYPVMGGIEQNIYHITKYLKANWNITVAIPAGQNPEAPREHEGIRIRKLSKAQFWSLAYDEYAAVILTNFAILPNAIILFRFLMLKIMRKRTPRLILVPHGGAILIRSQFSRQQGLIKALYNSLVGFPLVRTVVDKVVAVSQWESNELTNRLHTKNITVIQNGVQRIAPPNIDKGKYFVFVGRIQPVKNIEGIIELFNEVTKGFQSIDKLVIIGDHSKNIEYTEQLIKFAENLGVKSQIEFVGQKTGFEKDELIAKAQALICLSWIESDALAIKEALSLGTRAIIADRGGMSDYREQENVFMVNNNLEYGSHFTSIISKFLATPFKANVNNLQTWPSVAANYEAVI